MMTRCPLPQLRPMVRDQLGLVAGPEESFPGSDYSDDEREFLIAIERYKRERRRPHPTWREVLFVVRSLGYRKGKPADAGANR